MINTRSSTRFITSTSLTGRLHSLDRLFSQYGLEIFYADILPIHGGSMELLVAPLGMQKIDASVEKMRREEKNSAVTRLKPTKNLPPVFGKLKRNSWPFSVITTQKEKGLCLRGGGGARGVTARQPRSRSLFERPATGERAVLVRIGVGTRATAEDLEEFTALANAAGAVPVASVGGYRAKPDPRYFVGSGKAQEVCDVASAHSADVVLVDHPLSPSQERNLEELTRKRVLDRSGLILDIFAQRARSFEASSRWSWRS